MPKIQLVCSEDVLVFAEIGDNFFLQTNGKTYEYAALADRLPDGKFEFEVNWPDPVRIVLSHKEIQVLIPNDPV